MSGHRVGSKEPNPTERKNRDHPPERRRIKGEIGITIKKKRDQKQFFPCRKKTRKKRRPNYRLDFAQKSGTNTSSEGSDKKSTIKPGREAAKPAMGTLPMGGRSQTWQEWGKRSLFDSPDRGKLDGPETTAITRGQRGGSMFLGQEAKEGPFKGRLVLSGKVGGRS